MNFDPPMSYYSLQENFFDTLVQEIDNNLPKAHIMKTFKSVEGLIKFLFEEINNIINCEYFYHIRYVDHSLIISIKMSPRYYRYVKVVGITGNLKQKIKKGIVENIHPQHIKIANDLFNNSSYGLVSQPKPIKTDSCLIL